MSRMMADIVTYLQRNGEHVTCLFYSVHVLVTRVIISVQLQYMTLAINIVLSSPQVTITHIHIKLSYQDS